MNTWTNGLCILLALSLGNSTAISQNSSSEPDNSPATVAIVRPGPNLTQPELLPQVPLASVPNNCKENIEGKIRLAFIVDAQGATHDSIFFEPLGNDLDKLALLILQGEHFKPATQNGQPVATAQIVTMELKTCLTESLAADGTYTYSLHLLSAPSQKFSPRDDAPAYLRLRHTKEDEPSTGKSKKLGEGSLTHPKLLKYVDAKFSDEARRKNYSGICIIKLIVDSQGMPQNVKVMRTLGAGLDENAVEAVRHYRFLPAMENGSPIPVPITIEVRFNL